MITVSRLTEASARSAKELSALASILHEDSRTMNVADLAALVADKNVVLAVALDDGAVVGMGTLYIIPKVGKKNAYIEDVIVHEKYRGRGLGEQLTRLLIENAKKEGVVSISLTSRSHRVAAHKLYTKLGFSVQETNVFKLKL